MSQPAQSHPAPPPRPGGTAETRTMPGVGATGEAPPGQQTAGDHGPEPGPSRRGRTATVAVAVAAAALLLAVVSAGLSWRALDQANDARDIAVAAGAGTRDSGERDAGEQDARPTAPAQPATDPATGEPVPPDDPAITPQEPELNERTEFTVKYQNQPLRLRALCNNQMNADLDEPRVGVGSRHELIFNAECSGNTSFLTLADGVEGTQVDSSAMTPADCADQIRTGALPPYAQVPARRGVVMCVKTANAAAIEEGIPQKMVVLEVRGVSEDGTVTVQATAWNIPR